MNKIKKVGIVIPAFNEEDNIRPITEAAIDEIGMNLPGYDYEILIIDNNSSDNTQNIIRELCEENKKVKAIFNDKNFGPDNSPFYGMLQSSGDCVILLAADFQDPIYMITKLVKEWEKGYSAVTAVKITSKENKLIRWFRTLYYKTMKKISNTEIIEHFTGFGCYDRSFVDRLRGLEEPIPFFRGMISEFAGKRSTVEYEQQKRRAGKSHIRFFTLYDMAMRSFTSYTNVGLRIASFMGYFIAFFSLIFVIVYLVFKLIYWNEFSFGIPAIVIGMFFLGAVQLIFLGLIGEYIIAINQRTMKRPLVIERERINFDKDDDVQK